MGRASRKFSIEIDGFDDVVAQMRELDGDVHGIVNKALNATFHYVTPKVAEGIARHEGKGTYGRHRSDKTIYKDDNATWVGEQAYVKVGFDISNGGLATIFLMYGTPRHFDHHPGQDADKKLYDVFYGATTKKNVKKIQADILYDYLNKLRGL